MKKMIMFMAVAVLAIGANAAAVGWGGAGFADYKGNAYQFFIIGQNNVTGISTVTDILDKNGDTSSYAFGEGTINTSGLINQNATTSGKSLDAGTYESFLVLFDTTDVSEANKYVIISGGANQTKTFASTAASVSFTPGNASSIVSNPNNWVSVPEPTSGLLLIVGGALLALRRKQK